MLDILLGREQRPEDVSVMQPGPVRTERKDGLLGAVSEPLSYVPGPLGIVGQLGSAVASGDTGLGLLTGAALKSGPGKLSAIGDVFKLYGKKVANKSIHAANEREKQLHKEIAAGKRPAMTKDEIREDVWRYVGRQEGLKPVVKLPVDGEEVWVSEIPDYIKHSDFALPGKAVPISAFKGAGINNVNEAGIKRQAAAIPVESDFLPGSAYGGAYIHPLTDKAVKVRIRPDIIGTDKSTDTAAHELNHVLSRTYGFYQGGDPGMFAKAIPQNITANTTNAARYRALADLMDHARQSGVNWRDVLDVQPEKVSPLLAQSAREKGMTIEEAISEHLEKLGMPSKENGSSVFLRKMADRSEAAATQGTDMLGKYMLSNPPEVLDRIRKQFGSEAPAFWHYGNQADEAFARASGLRVNKDMEYRIENPFFSSDMMFRDKNNNAVWTPSLDDLFYNKTFTH